MLQKENWSKRKCSDFSPTS